MNVIKFHGCCRCGGDLFLDRDEDGEFFYCLQCGAVSSPPPPEKVPEMVVAPAVQSPAGSPAAASRSRSHRLISSRAGGAT
jgi:hypothetical protein